MGNSELDYSPPGGVFLDGDMLVGGIGCIAIAPRPGVDLLLTEFDDSIYSEWESDFTFAPPGTEEFVKPAIVKSGTALDDIAQYMPPGVLTLHESFNLEVADSRVLQHLDFMVSSATIPASWAKEKVEEPSADCLEYTKRVVRHLFVGYSLIPHKVSVSKDGGILAVFRQPFGRNILRVEVDNELDAVAVVTDGDSILNSGLLEQDDQEDRVIETFVGGMA